MQQRSPVSPPEPMPFEGLAATEPMPFDPRDRVEAQATQPSLDLETIELSLEAPEPARSPVFVAAPVNAPAPASDEEIDEEMLEIFMEEANEVVATARAALDLLASSPSDKNQITTVRRVNQWRLVKLGQRIPAYVLSRRRVSQIRRSDFVAFQPARHQS